jgi:diaminopimelate epimerase
MTGTDERGVGGLPRRFTKMSGAGNDFLVFNERVGVGPQEAATMRRLCERGRGVGADGVLFLSVVPGDVPVIVAAYYNADGGPARFCANGTRCAARFGSLRLGTGVELTVRTGWGDIGATVRPDAQVTLRLPEPIAVGKELSTFDPDEVLVERTGLTVSVGVPHFIVCTSGRIGLDRIDLAAVAPRMRYHPALPDGANVHFIAPIPGGRLAIRSWERGVERETLACGSGVVAAAVVAARREGMTPPVTIETRSGENLVVDFRLDEGVAWDVTLTGDARIVFEGMLNEEVL